MIARLKGVVDSVAADSCVVDVGGVGYLVFCSRRALGRLARGEAVALHIDTHVREDHIHLYGFLETAERDWFRLLMSVQGVGGRVALAILSVLSPDELTTAIAAQDRVAVTRADGVGPKLAGRIVSELKDKAGSISLGAASTGAPAPATAGGGSTGGVTADAVSALVNLGYGRSEAFGAVATAARKLGPDAAVGALIPAALKELSA
ncbi:MAG TPA: Holliday junction branch migration protein RuvA [Alphaproteobacteria bacterium]|nr:Holliday junction branch migration protein RuvA [Alphaproteobacteria bacterium]